ncbi:hypothetical protein GCM10022221_22400 [Actinocorallia aurea]
MKLLRAVIVFFAIMLIGVTALQGAIAYLELALLLAIAAAGAALTYRRW